MSDWRKCRKLPIVVHWRYVRVGEKGVETLEGYKECDLNKHFIIKGVEGEEYPIRQDIFFKTYEEIED